MDIEVSDESVSNSAVQRAALDAIAAKYAPAETEETEVTAEAEPAIAAEPAAAVAAVEPVKTPDPDEDVVLRAKQLEILTRREKEMREREVRLKEQEEKVLQYQKMAAIASKDPVAALKSLGITDLHFAAQQLLAEALGDDAPPDLLSKAKESRVERELRELREKLEQRELEAKKAPEEAIFQARVDAADREIQAFVKSPPAELKFLSKAYANDPEDTYNALCQIAAPLIQQGKWPSAIELGRMLDDQLKRNWEALRPEEIVAAQSTKTAPESSPKPMTTLSEADKNQRPDKNHEKLMSRDEYRKRALLKLKEFQDASKG